MTTSTEPTTETEGATVDPAPTDPAPAEPPATGDPGFPAGTAVKDMTAEQQAAYWRQQSRKHESALKRVTGELTAAQEAAKTDAERALDAAKAEGRAEASKSLAARLAVAEFRAASGGRVDGDALAALRIDPAAYIDAATGEPDTEAIAAAVARLAPAPTTPPPTPPVHTGGGSSGGGLSAAEHAEQLRAAGDIAGAIAAKAALLRQQQ